MKCRQTARTRGDSVGTERGLAETDVNGGKKGKGREGGGEAHRAHR